MDKMIKHGITYWKSVCLRIYVNYKAYVKKFTNAFLMHITRKLDIVRTWTNSIRRGCICVPIVYICVSMVQFLYLFADL